MLDCCEGDTVYEQLQELYDICLTGTAQQVDEYLNAGNEESKVELINTPTGIGSATLLHLCVQKKIADKKVIESLIKHGADLKIKIENGDTALHIAACIDDEKSVNFLLDSKHNICPHQTETCKCGKEAMFEENINKRRPRDEAKLNSAKVLQKLNEEEILYFLGEGKSPSKIYELIEGKKIGIDVSSDFFQEKLMKKCIDIKYMRLLPIIIWKLAKNDETFLDKSVKYAYVNCRDDNVFYFLLIFCQIKKNGIVFISFLNGDSFNIQARFDDKELTLTNDDREKLRNILSLPINVACLVSFALFHASDTCITGFLLEKLVKVKGKMKKAEWSDLKLTDLNVEWLKLPRIVACTDLNLTQNSLDVLPSFIIKLSENLTKLDVSRNCLKSIDAEVFKLEHLKTLNLSHNQIRRLPTNINCSESLNSLHLKDNLLMKLPMSLSGSCISFLDISYNKFENVPLCICDMLLLKQLDLSGNSGIFVFPKEMGRLNPDVLIMLDNMDQLIYPKSMYDHGTKNLIHHLRRTLHDSKRNKTMNLMVVGPWSHGKTRLLDCLLRRAKDGLPDPTKGIELNNEPMKFWSGFHHYKLRVIDFEGEIENQCFLTNRTLYLLVWNVNEDARQLKGWVDCLVSYVPNSHVIVVGTHKDNCKKTERECMDELNNVLSSEIRYKKLKFNNVFHLVSCSRNHRAEINALRKDIYKAALQVKHGEIEEPVLGGKVPTFYLSLAEKLKKMSEKRRLLEMCGPPILEQDAFLALIDDLQTKCLPVKYCQHVEPVNQRDIDHAVRFLHDTGVLLHFNNANQNLGNIYFIDIKWFQEILLNLQKDDIARGKRGLLSHNEMKEIIRNVKPSYDFNSGYFKFLQLYHVGFNTSKSTMQIAYFMKKKKPPTVQKAEKFLRLQSFLRLHAFNYIPFGFWLQLISRILYLFPQMLLGTEFSYGEYQEARNSENLQELFKDKLLYWKQGLVYQDEENATYISVSEIDVSINFKNCRELKQKTVLMTEVITGNSDLSTKYLATLVDHIRTIIQEWCNYLSQTDGRDPGVMQYVPCRSCIQSIKNPPYLFNLNKCLMHLATEDFQRQARVVCHMHQFNQWSPISLLYPELLFNDHPKCRLLKCHHLRLQAEQVPRCGGEGKVYRGKLVPHHCCSNMRERICEIGSCSLDREVNFEDGLDVAIKKRHFDVTDIDYVDKFYEFRKEVLMLNTASTHPNIVSFYGIQLGNQSNEVVTSSTGNPLTMVMEYANDGSLSDLIKNADGNPIDRILIYRMAYQIIDAISFLHSLDMLYRDLKPDNVLLFSDNVHRSINVKIGDFGTANFIGARGMAVLVGTPRYFAPELVNKQSGYTQAVDVWCFALVLYELISGKKPFYSIEANKVADHIKVKKRPQFKYVKRKDVCMLEALIRKSWEQNPADRPSAENVSNILLSTCFQLLTRSVSCYGTQDVSLVIPYCSENNANEVCYLSGDYKTLHILNVGDDNTDIIDLNSVKMENKDVPGNYYPFDPTHGKISSFQIICGDYAVSTVEVDDVMKFIVLKVSRQPTMQCVSITEVLPKVTQFEPLDGTVKKIVCAKDVLFIQYEDNTLHKICGFRNGNYNFDTQEVVDVEVDLVDMLLVGEVLILGYRAHVNMYMVYNQGRNLGVGTETRLQHDKRLQSLYCCEDKVFITHTRSAEFTVLVFDKETNPVTIKDSFYFNLNAENSVQRDLNMCSFCCIHDTLWVGTTNGMILIFSINDEIKLVKKIQPYNSEVKTLFALHSSIVKDRILSYGKRLNPAAFNDHNQIHKLNRKCFGAKKQHVRKENDSSDLFLMWHAPLVGKMKRYPTSTDNEGTDEGSSIRTDLFRMSEYCYR